MVERDGRGRTRRRSERIRAELARQVASPVRFIEEIEAMYAAGARVFVEAGPGGVLTGLVDAILGDRPHRAVAVDRHRRPARHNLLLGLGRIAAAGVTSDRRAALRRPQRRPRLGRRRRRRPGWVVNGHLIRTAAGDT